MEAATLYRERAKQQHADGREFIAEISPQPGDTVLDLGCGTGGLTAHLAELVGPNGRVLGVDPDGTRIKLAQQTYQHVKNLAFETGSSDNFPHMGMAAYDLIFSNFVFHWIFDKEEVLATLFQSLKPGGTVAIQSVAAKTVLLEKVIGEFFLNKSDEIWGKWCLDSKESLVDYHLRNGFEILASSEFVRRDSYPSLMDFCKWLEAVTHGEVCVDSVPKERVEQMAAKLKNMGGTEEIVAEHLLVRTIARRPAKI